MKITGIKLNNFKSIQEMFMDLKNRDNQVKKVVAIYGENGAGKSTIIDSFKYLCLSIRTLDNLGEFIKIRESMIEQSNNSEFDPTKILERSKASMYTNIHDVFKDSHTINSKQNTTIKYYYALDGKDGYYQLTFSPDNELLEEEMYHTVNKNRGILFDLKKGEKINFNSSLIKDKSLKKEIANKVNRYWGHHTLLSIISNEIKHNNLKFIQENIKSNILDFIKNIANTSFYQHSVSSGMIVSSQHIKGVNIESGQIPVSWKSHLTLIEDILNTFITSSYSDVTKVFYEVNKNTKRIKYRLIFRKKIAGKELDIPVRLESGGTRRLIRILPLLIDAIRGRVVIIDEIDNGIHDLLISRILKAVANNMNGQLIFTTHNTQLMNSLNSSNVFIINTSRDGRKDVYSLDEFGLRTTNNMAKMYLEGKFDGVPYPDEEGIKILMEDFSQNESN